jgi:VWFA-related protein
VVVDVVVTRSDGDAITGLARQDFAITEDGVPQTIDFFEEHTGSAQTSGPPPAMPEMPAGAKTNVPPVPESDAVNVLLLDTLNSEQQDQVYVRNQVMNFLAHMQPGTRVAIFILGSKLRFVQGFTTDTSVLLAALNAKQNGPQKNRNFQSRSDVAGDADEVAMLQTMQASPYAIEALQAAQTDVAAYSYGARAAMTFEALTYLGHYLAGVPGRKNLIWFAESFPVIIFPTSEQRLQLKKTGPPGYLDKVRQTADLFTLSKVAVYPVSAAGVMVEHIIDAGAAAPGGGSLGHIGSSADTTMAPYIGGAAARADAIYAMEQLAASTGGKAYYNTNDLNGAMRRAINDGAHYYTLAYAPTARKMDGGYRQIEVKLSQGKYKLAYRHGYNTDDAPPVDANSTGDPLAPLLALGLPAASGVLYGVQVAPAATQPGPDADRAGDNPALKGPLMRYGADFVIRVDDVTWQADSRGRRSGRILIGLKAYDHNGNPLNWAGTMETLEMSAEEYESRKKTGIPARLEIDLPSDPGLRVVTAVYDWNSGKAGSLEVPAGRL